MNQENSVILRTIILASIILGGLFIGINFLEDNIIAFVGKHGRNVATGLKLLSLWLVVSASIRSVVALEKKVPGVKLLLTGVSISILSTLVLSLFLTVYPQFKGIKGENPDTSSGSALTIFSILGFVVSLIAIINAKVKNRHLGNLLELLVIVIAAGLFIYYATR